MVISADPEKIVSEVNLLFRNAYGPIDVTEPGIVNPPMNP